MHYQEYSGKAISAIISELANIRIEVFKEFPYLYEGDLLYEQKYLQHYTECDESYVCAAYDGGTFVGATTAIALENADDAFKAPFAALGLDISKVFYLGESVVLPDHRGKGIGKEFFRKREWAASDFSARRLRRGQPSFTTLTFCAVMRATTDPRRPDGYRSLAPFWRSQGFASYPELASTFDWKELRAAKMSSQWMSFWIKEIR